MARPDMSARLTPRQAQGQHRLAEMLYTARAVKGDAFGSVAYAAVQARVSMAAFDHGIGRTASFAERGRIAHNLMDVVRQLATTLDLPPGMLAEALKHARVMYCEAYER